MAEHGTARPDAVAAAAPAGRRGSARRERTALAVLVLAGALLGFLAGSRPWVLADVSGLAAGERLVASGRQAAGVVPAVALVALAGGVAVLTTRQVGRVVAGALLALAGAASAAVSVGVLRTPSSAVAGVVEAATGRAGETAVEVTVTAWPWAGVASGVLVALAGALAVTRARAFGGLSSRYDAPATAATTTGPTAPPDGAARPTAAGPAAATGSAQPPATAPTEVPTTTPSRDHGDGDRDPGEVWDALSRGEDPTR